MNSGTIRDASESVGGTGELLLKAATEIDQLKARAVKAQERISHLKAALETTRDVFNRVVDEALDMQGRFVHDIKDIQAALSETAQQAEARSAPLRTLGDETNQNILKALGPKKEAG